MLLLKKRRIINFLFLSLSALIFYACSTQKKEYVKHDLFMGFQNPPAEARPFVRWWWNGNKVKASELDRELESLHSVGFGGVEINPIAMPVGPDNGDRALVWMSDEWIDMVVHACKKTKDLGMIADMIAGTGWPFGGEFLQDNETSQRMVSDHILYKQGETIEADEARLVELFKDKHKNNRSQKHISKRTTYRLSFVKLVPENCNDTNQIVDLKNHKDANGKISYQIVHKGNYVLSYGLIQQNFRDVTLGAPGGAGPVMDHYRKEMTLAYLNRMKKISERSGMPLSDLIRAIFCDSIEVSGANWTDGFENLFFEAYGYKLDNWLPFVFCQANGNYSQGTYSENFTPEFKDQLKRVRYDYNKLLVEVFLKNFTQTYKDFCEDNNILCRYQAYGTPFLMGMLDGYMIPDIPESNNWIYTVEMKDSVWDWKQSHGYMIWNMYASAGAHLTDKKITSCETMTNLGGVFKATLEEIKQHDDMNFITGINHSVLHGYNYSPPEVEFPGWIRFGAYFSEQNTWWKHLPNWIDYNSRLSYVFQNSQADKSIAILGPTADLWGDKGLVRTPFHMEPEYLYRLWEPISQLGYSAEYINQGVLERATVNEKGITYGNMTYKLLMLASLKSLSPKAAENIKLFVESGGEIIVIDQLPLKSLHFSEYEKNDDLVNTTMTSLLANYPESVIQVKHPESINAVFNWTNDVLKTTRLEADVAISHPSENVYQIHQYTDDKDIYFFTNVSRYSTTSFDAKFPVDGKYPYIWNPETGEKTPYYFESNSNELSVTLNPLESLLLVFEDERPLVKAIEVVTKIKESKVLDVHWKVIGKRKDEKVFTWDMPTLIDFSKSKDSTQNTFGGEIVYKTTINNAEDFTHLDLGNVNEGITELYVNGQNVGKRWYGKAVYSISDYLKKGENAIEIHYTTVLANYTKSLKNNKMAYEWTKRYKDLVPTGIEGPVTLLNYELR
ncbi:glycosyl hydrolase [Algibacter luteus]|uniref:glycosyl hydrolase n=1 Tax=Algibacter luteus TaxID=1178825 RepID=UPI002598BADA|nr:glycosyl hydrolase [Algibacter luteus]WJJ97728.1 glycosyl hydrolase [Algibacter luteus]